MMKGKMIKPVRRLPSMMRSPKEKKNKAIEETAGNGEDTEGKKVRPMRRLPQLMRILPQRTT